MHIPDGFLSVPVAAASGALAAAGLGLALRRAQRELPPRRVPLLGLAAAFVFAAQMLNFPVVGGTSGHLIGSVLAAVLVGPSAAVVVMSAVVIVQCFLFADGGVTALGANIFNMAIVAPLVGYPVFLLVVRAFPGLRGRLAGAMFAAWCSTVVASLACAGQLAASETAAWKVVVPAMGGIHMMIGLGEALITGMVLAALARSRPELVENRPAEAVRNPAGLVAVGLVVALGLAVFASPFASSWPDGLERVAETLGFAGRAADVPALRAPMPDYAIPGLDSPGVATAAAGAVGALVAFGACWLAAWLLAPAKLAGSRDGAQTA